MSTSRPPLHDARRCRPVVERGLIAAVRARRARPRALRGRGAPAARRGDSATTRRQCAARPSSDMCSAGDWIVRMDQPYTRAHPHRARGPALPSRRSVAVRRHGLDARPAAPRDDVHDRRLDRAHEADAPLTADAGSEGASRGTGGTLVVTHSGDWRSAVLPWKVGRGESRSPTPRSP